MDCSESITALRLVAAIAILSYASALDWRTRKVGNLYWIGLSVLGLLLIPVQLSIDGESMEYALVLVPILAILSDVYWDSGQKSGLARIAPWLKYAAAIVSTMLLGYMWIDSPYFQHLAAVPVMMLFIVLMYILDVIRGGADAKALLALSILFPFYPSIGSLPILQDGEEAIEILFPFSFVVLVTAAIIVALFPLGFLAKNLSRREFRFPQGLLGYRMDAKSLSGRHVWLMERIENGNHHLYTRPKPDEDLEKEVQKLVEKGYKRIWITPKIPFIIPMLVSLLFATVVGNILLLLFSP